MSAGTLAKKAPKAAKGAKSAKSTEVVREGSKTAQARLPANALYDGEKNLVTTGQFFALWRAVGELSSDPAAGLKIATQIDVGSRPPSTIAAYHARDYRGALTRLVRFKQLCSPEELQIKTSKDECLSCLQCRVA
ncbi:MAG TPA: AraC family transcriptional regulator ligand-binding domain-containing protein [Bryobacteraceae bacterium]